MTARDWEAAYHEAMAKVAELHQEHIALVEEHHALIRESYHRAQTHLHLIVQSVNRRLANSRDPAVHHFAEQVMAQVKATARLYQCLATAQGDVEMSGYLRDLCSDLRDIGGNPMIKLEVKVPEIVLNADRAMPLGLITSELVTNAYRHGFQRRGAGNILVEVLREYPGQMALSVADTGDGFDDSFVKRGGCQIVETLARRLGGSVIYGDGPGARVKVRFAFEEAERISA